MFRQYNKSLKLFMVLLVGTFFILGSVDTSRGQVIDSPVGNLTYKCGVKVDKTDQDGWFECSVFPVKFFVGSLEIGSMGAMPSDSKVFIQDLVGVSRSSFDNEKVIKIARFLQSLNDGSTANIWLDNNLKELFSNTQKSLGDLTVLEIEGILGVELVSEDEAVQHLKDHSEVSQTTDTTKPVITLQGDATVQLNVGDTYTDAGAKATDNIDGNITGSIVLVNPVDTSVANTYTVTYNVQDSSGNNATEVTRTVIVNAVVGSKRFSVDTANGTALDTQTNLLWQNNQIGHSTRAGAITRCDNLDFAGFSDWRLSTQAESKIFHSEMNNQGDVPKQSFSRCTAEVVSDGYVRTKKGATKYGGEPGDTIGFGGSANVRCVREAGGDPDPITSIEDQIVKKHNEYRKEVFTGNDLVWDATLAEHAQAWADYLAANYTQADAGKSPHASAFNQATHGLPYSGEGENIAWSSYGRGYIASIDAWASEKAYYDYATNASTDPTKAVGHYTQIVWKNTTKVGCGIAQSTTDYGGEHVVCRYSPPGNYIGEKPY